MPRKMFGFPKLTPILCLCAGLPSCDWASERAIHGLRAREEAGRKIDRYELAKPKLAARLATFQTAAWQPEEGDIFFAAREAVHRQTYAATRVVGGGFATDEFDEFPPEGGVLIGFRLGRDEFVGNPTIGSFRAIYLTATGSVLGRQYGTARNAPVDLVARPGYAVGAINIRGGGGMDAVSLTFMKIDGNRLDPTTAYTSEKIGGNGGSEGDFNGNGVPIIGIRGRRDAANKWPGLGVIFMSPIGEAWQNPAELQERGPSEADREPHEAPVAWARPWLTNVEPQLVIGVVLAVFVVAMRLRRRSTVPAEPLLCPSCRVANATHARFCRRCGKRLRA